MTSLNAQQLRQALPTDSEIDFVRARRREIYLLLDNITDTYNIGCFFRLADAWGVKKMWLAGRTETPPNPRIDKSSVGTHRWVDWYYASSSRSQILLCKQEIPDLQVIAIEQNSRSIPVTKMTKKLPILFIVGNETSGISNDVLEVCDQIVELEMFGINKSMNVLVSAVMVLAAREFGASNG